MEIQCEPNHTNQQNDDVSICVVPHLFQPPLDILVSQVFGDVVDKESSHCPAIVPGHDHKIVPGHDHKIVPGHDHKIVPGHDHHHEEETLTQRGDRPVTLLSGSVPDLGLNSLAVILDRLCRTRNMGRFYSPHSSSRAVFHTCSHMFSVPKRNIQQKF